MVLHQGCPHRGQKCNCHCRYRRPNQCNLLHNFLAAGFNRSSLIPASDLVAANHSGMEIEGAFFAVIKRLGTDKANAQCHAMIYVSADVSTLYLSQATLLDQGVLSSQFPLVGEHQPLNTHKQNSATKPFCASIRSA